MKRSLAILLVLGALAATTPAFADAYDCFPGCPPQAGEPKAMNLCDSAVVREGLRVERELQPVKELVGIVTDPKGFALKQVNDHIVRIPPWVHLAMDPEGYVKGKVMKRVRQEVRKGAGIESCDATPPEPDPLA